MKRATVSTSEDVAENFRLITLEGPALRGAAWAPGHKIQIAMGSAFVARTYTPIEWDAAGRTLLLGYSHGQGPGSAWLGGARPGDSCDIFGPRRSLDLGALPGALAVLGDETSIGLACALRRAGRVHPKACLFEFGNVEAGRRVLARLGLDGATLFDRSDDGAHCARMEAALSAFVAKDFTFVLTGKATTIQLLRQRLRCLGVPPMRLAAKAYWAPGKTGFD
ncbi:siderophore-interacting protein [Gluconacetobacter sacchari]|uniref:siderophore-interacting protein n=1 Tax=Gluconacetobacter sacchari TaxID=92759 RepID=UPI0039B550B3